MEGQFELNNAQLEETVDVHKVLHGGFEGEIPVTDEELMDAAQKLGFNLDGINGFDRIQ